ncbi:MAG: MFS transporter [Phycisphaerae bacterium]|nr:MFS transporter [Gemmatimonadaceae bacterium]
MSETPADSKPPASTEIRETSEHAVPSAAKGKLVVLMVTAFMDMVGMLMILPLMPFYATKLGAGGLVVGLLVSSFSVAQLLSAPLWGRVSDRYGRRPALMVGLFASAIAYIVFAYADQLWLLFLSRLIQGAGGGTVSVIQAYVADATKPDDRAKSLGWLSAATNAGVAIGPILGGLVLPLGEHAPGLFAAALCLINMGFAWRYLVESRTLGSASEKKAIPRTSREAVLRVVTHPNEPSSRLIFIYGISIGAFQGCTSILALLLAVRFDVTEKTIGIFFMYIGVLSVVTRGFLLERVLNRFGEARLSRYGLVLLAVGLVGVAFSHNLVALAISVGLWPLGTAFTFPSVTAMLSRVIGSHERGLYMGVQQTYGGISRVAFPTLFGFAYDYIGMQSPFIISAALVLGTLLLGRDLEKYAPRTIKPAVAKT